MNTSLRRRLLSAAVVIGLGLAGAACAKPGTPGASPSPSTSATASPTPTPTPTPMPTPTPTPTPTRTSPAHGPVWPLIMRTVDATTPTAAARLTAIRTGRHDTYDRVVFDFTGPVGTAGVKYVPIVHADPSDLTVPLLGNAFLEVTIHSAYARWGTSPTKYRGPDSVTPAYPTLKQVTMSGDVENVLSFGIGLDRTAGFRVFTLTSPTRLVIDVAHTPAWRMWPDLSLALAKETQAAFESGIDLWRDSVLEYYGERVFGWTDVVVTHIAGTGDYWISQAGSTERVRVHQVWPFARGGHASIAEITDVR